MSEMLCRHDILKLLSEQIELLHRVIMESVPEHIPALVDAQLRLLQEMARQ